MNENEKRREYERLQNRKDPRLLWQLGWLTCRGGEHIKKRINVGQRRSKGRVSKRCLAAQKCYIKQPGGMGERTHIWRERRGGPCKIRDRAPHVELE